MSQQNQPSNITTTAEELPGGTVRVSFGRPDPAVHDSAMAAKAESANVRTKVWTQEDRISVNVGREVGVANAQGVISSAVLNNRTVTGDAITDRAVIQYPGFGDIRIIDAINAGLAERTATGYRLVGTSPKL